MKYFENNKKITAVDIFIAFLVLMCALGICVRVFIAGNGLFSPDEGVGEYYVRFTVSGEKSENTDHFDDGKTFFLDGDDVFGTVSGNYKSTPSKDYFENRAGEYEFVYSSDGRVDISATMLVTGVMTDSGFLLNGSEYIAPNMELSVHSADIAAKVLITDIREAS